MPRKRTPKALGIIELIQGTNDDGDEVYAFVSIREADYPIYRKVSSTGEIFDPREYGELLAHGKGEPPERLTRELAMKYDLPPGFEEAMSALGEKVTMDSD